MNCSETEKLLSARLEGEATASQWRMAEEHLAACPQCAQVWQSFQSTTLLFKTRLPRLAPSARLEKNIWARLDNVEETQRPWRFNEWWRRHFAPSFWPTPRAVHAVRLGFAVLLLALMGLPFMLERSQTEKQPNLTSVGRDTTLAAATLPPSRKVETQPKMMVSTGLEQQMENYLEDTRLILLEVKNSAGEEQALDLHGLRQASQRLLEQAVILKADLKQEKAAVLQNLVEQLELVLLDLANLADDPQREEVEMLRAAIRQNDLLIKIEIVDLKALERTVEPRSTAKRRPLNKTAI